MKILHLFQWQSHKWSKERRDGTHTDDLRQKGQTVHITSTRKAPRVCDVGLTNKNKKLGINQAIVNEAFVCVCVCINTATPVKKKKKSSSGYEKKQQQQKIGKPTASSQPHICIISGVGPVDSPPFFFSFSL